MAQDKQKPAVAKGTKKADPAGGKQTAKQSVIKQYKIAWTMTRKTDTRMPIIVVAVFLVVFAIMLAIGFLIKSPILYGILGAVIAVLAALIVFGRRAQAAMYKSVENQPGASASIIESLRGFWRVTPMAAADARSQAMVHRVLGRCGVVLVGEGDPARAAALMAQEKKRVNRVAADVPISEVLIGDGPGQLPLRKIQSKFGKMPKTFSTAQVRAIEGRMRALAAVKPPIPPGPLPRNIRMPKAQAPKGSVR